ncbi:MAG: PadR family transcriptional regulator [Henriciella sp.]|nr:PadR family transcriptional regulator [Henriciella sp.]
MSHALHPSSFIILGIVERLGDATSYDLKNWADGSIGYFWNFSRASLYKEPARLVQLGLLSERQEETGRRRRLYAMTDKGRTALSDWLATPSEQATEIRDLGLLKLYFAQSGTQAALDSLIQDQLLAHRHRLETYRTLEQDLAANPDYRFYAAALAMGLKYEEMSVAYWQDLAKAQLKVE